MNLWDEENDTVYDTCDRKPAAACGCDPGTFEDGWMETRSAACREAELQEWRRLFDQLPIIINEVRRTR